MSLVGLSWAKTGATDVHLLPGLVSPQLKRLLLAEDLNTATNKIELKPLNQMAGLTVVFAAQLNGTPASHGVTLGTDGAVTVDSAALKGRSFIVTATATQDTATETTRIRIYVHNAIQRMWLTPSRLTVRRGASGVRLSVLAQFDDGVIGDITNWSPFEKPTTLDGGTYVHGKGSNTPALAWSAESIPPGNITRISADAVTGVLDASADNGSSKITVKFGARSASATAVCERPWTTQVRLTHISGPGPKDVNFVPNVLFLPDGFVGGDKTEYERLVRTVVMRLSTRNRTRPFAALTERMNYFMGWVPSPEPGISVLNELDRTKKTATVSDGRGLELPSVVRRPLGRWKLDDLVNAVGLPTPVEDSDNSTLTDAKVTAWQGIYGNFITKPRVQPLFAEWLSRNDRVLLNERDTAFHMAFGDRPSLEGDTSDRGLGFNPRRLTDDDFNGFLDSLRGPKGEALGQLWTTGKDRGLVVILCRTARHGGMNATRPVPGDKVGNTIGISLSSKVVHRMKKPDAGGDGFELVPDDIPRRDYFGVWLTTAHELAHSWTLGDEYGGLNTAVTADVVHEASVSANLQDRASLLAGGHITTDNFKWGAWPRIAKAGVLGIAPIPVAGGKFRVIVTDIKASRLRVKDIVQLRARPLPTAGPASARCKIESITDSAVVIRPLFGAVVDPAKFPAGSILMMPVRAKDPNPAADLYGDDLMLADVDVLVRIALTGNPLNAQPIAGEGKAPNDVFDRPCKAVELPVPTPATNFPDRKPPKPPSFSSWIVGVYENGGEHNCGIYRPTGICLMTEQAKIDEKSKTLNLYDFCIICRYAIVDAVDPTRHGQVEIDFVGRYGRGSAP